MRRESNIVGRDIVGVSLFIVNKQGTLVYQKDFTHSSLSANDKIRMASMFYSLSAIASETSPTEGKNTQFGFLQPTGILSLDANQFRLQCFPTLTGMKIFVIAPTGTRDLSDLLQQVYIAYSDFVLKDIFHDLDMPIRSPRFESSISNIFSEFTSGRVV